MRNDLVVYVGRSGGRVMYVGQGLPTRPEHLNSGISQCYLANQHHFRGKSVQIEIVESGLSRSEALKREAELINELQPLWNRAPGVGVRHESMLPKEAVIELNRYAKQQFRRYPDSYEQYKTLLLYLIKFCDKDGHLEDTQMNISNKAPGKIMSGFLYGAADLGENSHKRKEISKFFTVEALGGGRYRLQLSDQIMAKVRRIQANRKANS